MTHYVEMTIATKTRPEPRTFWERPIWALGFRPFFLLGAGLSAIWMVLWVLVLRGAVPVGGALGPIGWHAHEMLFGFTVAIIAGFLLTAVRNWTNVPTPTGAKLAGLSALWLAGRIGLLFSGALPYALVAAVDIAFLPLLAIAIARPIIVSKNRRNFGFIPLLGVLALANVLYHLEAAGLLGALAGAQRGLNLALGTIVVIMVVIGGRVIPFFTKNWTRDERVDRSPALDKVAVASTVLLLAVELIALWPAVTGAVALFAGVANAARMWRWGTLRTWRFPLLWVLHVGYAFIAIGLVLKGLSLVWGVVPMAAAVHALTAGAIGVLTLGMMARVALGHTGRPLEPARIISVAFGLITLSAIVRIVVAMFPTLGYLTLLTVSGALWSLAFLVYFVVYWPILTTPRPDGRAG